MVVLSTNAVSGLCRSVAATFIKPENMRPTPATRTITAAPMTLFKHFIPTSMDTAASDSRVV